MTEVVLTLALILLPNSLFAQKSNHPALGWDLSYTTILNANQIAQDEWIRKWIGPHFQSPITKHISGWNGEPIESSILIEHPAFHAGEHITLWFVRTKNHAYHWGLIEGKPPRSVKESLDPALYDKFFAVVSAWQQASPLKAEDTPDGGIPGYIGFLSVYDRGHSRQMLLTLNDFFLCETKKCENVKGGRLTQAMENFPHD
jgi:hypothetical protein